MDFVICFVKLFVKGKWRMANGRDEEKQDSFGALDGVDAYSGFTLKLFIADIYLWRAVCSLICFPDLFSASQVVLFEF